jgi:hypothetical protein
MTDLARIPGLAALGVAEAHTRLAS